MDISANIKVTRKANDKTKLCFYLQSGCTLAVINIGAPAGGMSTAVRAFVRFSLFNGHSVLGIRDGIDGLLQDKVLSKLLSNSQRECGRVTFSKLGQNALVRLS